MFNIHVHKVPNSLVTSRAMRDEFANDRRYRKLGSGAFGSAWTRTDSKIKQVIKMTHGNDWGYMAYLEMLSKVAAANPWLPRIDLVNVYMDRDGDTCMVAIMEHLETIEQLPDRDRFRTEIEEIGEYIRERNSANWIKRDPQLLRAAEVVRAAHRRSRCSYDLHTGNILVRNKTQLVITDPLGYPS